MPVPYKVPRPSTIVISVMYILMGILALTLRGELSDVLHFPYIGIAFFGASLLFVGVGTLLLRYLRGDLTPVSRSIDEQSRWPKIGEPYTALILEMGEKLELIDELNKRVETIESRPLNLKELAPSERETLLSNLRTQLQSVLASDLMQEIEQNYSSKIVESAQIAQIRRKIDLTTLRLTKEIEALTRRGNLNLVIGALTTIAAVVLLAYLVLGATVNYTNLPDLFSHVIPRISIAIFIEVFSFFFLKLYKSSLQEIKYFQNELTNIEMKAIALETALLTLSSQPTNPIIDQLIRTDRNQMNVTVQSATEKDGKQIAPKDIADILDKLSKLLNLGGSK